jgi:hypothetical protein
MRVSDGWMTLLPEGGCCADPVPGTAKKRYSSNAAGNILVMVKIFKL